MVNLGINNESITYEVALEAIGSRIQPLAQAWYKEQKKENPSKILIDYYNSRIIALNDLMEDLRHTDVEIIEKIFAGDII